MPTKKRSKFVDVQLNSEVRFVEGVVKMLSKESEHVNNLFIEVCTGITMAKITALHVKRVHPNLDPGAVMLLYNLTNEAYDIFRKMPMEKQMKLGRIERILIRSRKEIAKIV